MDKQVTITNGVGETDLINGSYNVTAEIPGYDNCSITPNSLEVSSTQNEYAFEVVASGTLTLHVTEEGLETGTPVEGATFIRTDSVGNTYGNPITSDIDGNAVFANVPFGDSAPAIYFKQQNSDGDHEFNGEVQSVTMSTSKETVEIQNARGEERTITLTDANYENLPIESGTLTFTNV